MTATEIRDELAVLRCTRRIFVKAKTFIKKGWVQGRAAEDRHGEAVQPDATSACKWCASGAIERASWDTSITEDVANDTLDNIVGSKYQHSFVEYNDAPHMTQTKVLRLFDKGIAKMDRGIARLQKQKGAGR